MLKIKTVSELKDAIRLLEIQQAAEGVLLKEQFKLTYESLRPANLIKKTLHELVSSPDLKGGIVNALMGLGAGYLSKKAVAGNSHNPIKILLGAIMQMGVTKVVSANGDGIKSGIFQLIQKLFNKNNSA